MLGFVNICFEGFVIETYGEDIWVQVKAEADVSTSASWTSSSAYSDAQTHTMISKLVDITHAASSQDILEAWGCFFLGYFKKIGYWSLVSSLGSNLAEFMSRTNELHVHLSVAPSFHVQQVTPTWLIMNYESSRDGFWPFAAGIVKQVARELYNHEVTVELIQGKGPGNNFEVLKLTYPFQEGLQAWSDAHGLSLSRALSRGVSRRNSMRERDSSRAVSRAPSTKTATTAPPKTCMRSEPLQRLSPRPPQALDPGMTSSMRHTLIATAVSAAAPASLLNPLFGRDSVDSAAGLQAFSLPPELLCSVFPYHFVVNEQLVLVQMGNKLRELLPGVRLGESLMEDCFKIVHPQNIASRGSRLTLDRLHRKWHTSFLLEVAEQSPRQSPLDLPGTMGAAAGEGARELPPAAGLQLKGQMVVAALPCAAPCPDSEEEEEEEEEEVECPAARKSRDGEGNSLSDSASSPPLRKGPLVCPFARVAQEMRRQRGGEGERSSPSTPTSQRVGLFLGSPKISSMQQLRQFGLTLTDLPLSDRSFELALSGERNLVDMRIMEGYEELTIQLQAERARSEALLYRYLPKHVAQSLRDGRPVEATAHQELTVLFSDIVNFTSISSMMPPISVVRMLNALYSRFDALIDEYPDVWKANVIGDAYMLVANLDNNTKDHVDQIIDLAMGMQQAAAQVDNGLGQPIQIRIGIHTGPAVAGAVGGTNSSSMMCFSVFGDTVNTAARMESHGVPGEVHISLGSYTCIADKSKYNITERGKVMVKGKGPMQTYLISKHRDQWLVEHDRTVRAGRAHRADRAAKRMQDTTFARGSVHHPSTLLQSRARSMNKAASADRLSPGVPGSPSVHNASVQHGAFECGSSLASTALVHRASMLLFSEASMPHSESCPIMEILGAGDHDGDDGRVSSFSPLSRNVPSATVTRTKGQSFIQASPASPRDGAGGVLGRMSWAHLGLTDTRVHSTHSVGEGSSQATASVPPTSGPQPEADVDSAREARLRPGSPPAHPCSEVYRPPPPYVPADPDLLGQRPGIDLSVHVGKPAAWQPDAPRHAFGLARVWACLHPQARE